MSMDISIWSRSPPTLPADLPQSEAWIQDEYEGKRYYTFEGDSWLINVGSERAAARLRENCPDSAATVETYVSLEPIGASAEGYAFLERVVRTLAKASNGFWEHPGNGRFYGHDEGPF